LDQTVELVPFPQEGFLTSNKIPDEGFGFQGTQGQDFSKSYEKKKKAKFLSWTQLD
jgi:hypothetical protein